MTRNAVIALVGLLVLLGGYSLWTSWRLFGTQGEVDESSPGDFPTVIRTNGGMLEVATLKYRRSFNLTNSLTVLGYAVPFCQESASYTIDTYTTYRIRLAKRWLGDYHDGRLAVVAPPLEPALPVAFDTSRLKAALARCRFFPNLDTQDQLLRSIGRQLEQAALSPAYTAFAKDHGVHGGARDTVAEFARKWLLAQKNYAIPAATPIDVTFAGDPPRG